MYIEKKPEILFERDMKLLMQNLTSYSNIPERNMMGLAAASNTFQVPFISMLNADDLDYNSAANKVFS